MRWGPLTGALPPPAGMLPQVDCQPLCRVGHCKMESLSVERVTLEAQDHALSLTSIRSQASATRRRSEARLLLWRQRYVHELGFHLDLHYKAMKSACVCARRPPQLADSQGRGVLRRERRVRHVRQRLRPHLHLGQGTMPFGYGSMESECHDSFHKRFRASFSVCPRCREQACHGQQLLPRPCKNAFTSDGAPT